MYTIGKLAQQDEVSTDTVRYYKKEGLLIPVDMEKVNGNL